MRLLQSQSGKRLGAIVITKTDRTLATEAVGPEATDVSVDLRDPRVHDQEPGTENGLGEDVQDGISDDFGIHGGVASTISDSPNNGVRSPDDERKPGNGGEEGSNLATLGRGHSAAVDGQVPDDDEVGDAGDGVPAPLLGSALGTESGEETGQDHDDVRKDSHEDVSAVETGQQAEVKEQQRSGNGPVDVTGPEDLAVHLGESIGNVVVLMADLDGVDGYTVAGSHGKVRKGSGDGDGSGDDMVETTVHLDPPRQTGEDGGRDEHNNEDNP